MKLTAEQDSLLPSDADVMFYQEHGWYISPKILADEEIEDALQEVERIHAGERDFQLPIKLPPYLDWLPEQNPNVLRTNEYVVQQNLKVAKLARNPLIGAMAARLAGTRQIRLFVSSLLYKPPQHVANVHIGWHTDYAYWTTCTSQNMLTAWIPLHDCDEVMGTLLMIDRSHKWPSTELVEELRRGRTFMARDLATLDQKLEATGFPIERIPMKLKRGQMSFHHCRILHGSRPNLSTKPRITIGLHMQDEHNQYSLVRKENGELHVHNNDLMCRKLPDGTPDYTDPFICPVLY